MALILVLCFAAGVLLIFLSLSERPGSPRSASHVGLADRVLAFLQRNGAGDVSPRAFLVASTGSGLALGVIAQFALDWPAVSLTAFVAGLVLPGWYLQQRHERRRLAVQAALADAVDALRTSVRTGMSVEDAVGALAHHGPEVLQPLFGDLLRDWRLSGFEAGLQRARTALADSVFDTVAAALVMSHRIGGRNLSTVLENLSRAVRQSITVERELRAHQAKNVLSARIIAALPLVLIFAIRGLNPTYLDAFSSATGQLVLALCLLSVAVGYAAMLRATRLPLEGRVLA